MIISWWRQLTNRRGRRADRARRGRPRWRPQVEGLEDRLVPAPATPNVAPPSINLILGNNQSAVRTVSVTLPAGQPITAADVFLLFDDTSSFEATAPLLVAEFPNIISQLQAALPGVSLAFGIGRFEDYGGAAGQNITGGPVFGELQTGRPFILSQPVITTTTPGFTQAINGALTRTTPGFGGDIPEASLEALFQVATGAGYDGNNNGNRLDSGPAGLAATQTNPGTSGDVPPFTSFVPDPANNVLRATGTLGGVGFRPGALPIILLATDTGTAFQPDGRTVITSASGVSVPLADLTSGGRPATPFNTGANFQATVDALNRLGALVIGLGTGTDPASDPRRYLEGLARLTGAVNGSSATIDSGIAGDAITPGDPLYFLINPGSGAVVSRGIQAAIQAAITSVLGDVTVAPTLPGVRFANLTGVRRSVQPGSEAPFDVQFTGDGFRREYDLVFFRPGTGQFLGSLPVVIAPTAFPVVLPNFASKTQLLFSNFAFADGSVAGQAGFVNALYQEVLGRQADQGGVNFWVNMLQAGIPRVTVAISFWRSPEHRAMQVDDYYASLLDRPADPGGRQGWVNAFLAGATEEAVTRGFLNSAEYQARHATNAAFAAGLYEDVLNRTADAAGLAFFDQQLRAGVSRAAVVETFLNSTEGLFLAVNDLYQTYLRRNADLAGGLSWVNLLQSRRAGQELIGELLLASDEFFATHALVEA